MTAVLFDDAVLFADAMAMDDVLEEVMATPVKAPVTAPSAPRLTLVPAPRRRRRIEPPSDPMADLAGTVLSFPMRQAYAVLLRMGVIHVKA